MRVYKVIPTLDKQHILNLWHKAQDAQWSAERIDWHAPLRITEKVSKDRLARVMTPILMSEQSAFHSASQLLPLLGRNNEVESQYYLSTWLVDEARHAELFALMFERFDRQPTSPRRFPGAYFFQSKVMSDDVAVWLAGLLAVEVLAKHVMTELRRLDLDAALSQVCDGILEDEARHIGFNRIYVEDRIATLGARSTEEAQAFADQLDERLEAVLDAAPVLLGALDTELAEMGFRKDDVLDRLRDEARSRMGRTVRAGFRAIGRPRSLPSLAQVERLGS